MISIACRNPIIFFIATFACSLDQIGCSSGACRTIEYPPILQSCWIIACNESCASTTPLIRPITRPKVSLSHKKDQSETLPHYFVKWRGSVKFLLDSARWGRKALRFTRCVKCFAPRNHSSESERTAEGTARLDFIVFVILSSDPSRPCLSLPIVLLVCCVGYFAM